MNVAVEGRELVSVLPMSVVISVVGFETPEKSFTIGLEETVVPLVASESLTLVRLRKSGLVPVVNPIVNKLLPLTVELVVSTWLNGLLNAEIETGPAFAAEVVITRAAMTAARDRRMDMELSFSNVGRK